MQSETDRERYEALAETYFNKYPNLVHDKNAAYIWADLEIKGLAQHTNNGIVCMGFKFECIGMDGGSKFPIEYTGRGQDISPEFIIKNLSPNAKTLAVTLEDLSHPIKDFTHWVIWNIPATDRIKKNIPAGKTVPMLGMPARGRIWLAPLCGPKPPKGKKHTYRFTVYSLDCEINISANSMKRNFLKKAERHIIQKGSIVGEFE